MKKIEIVAISLLFSMMLTGCGKQNTIKSMAVDLQKGGLDTSADLENGQKNGSIVIGPNNTTVRSEKQREWIQKLLQCKQDFVKKNIIQEEEGMDEHSNFKNLIKLKRELENSTLDNSTGAFQEEMFGINTTESYRAADVSRQEDCIKQFLQALEEAGFSGVGSLALPKEGEEKNYVDMVSRGIHFYLLKEEESKQLRLTAEVAFYSLYYPKDYVEYIDSSLENGFYVCGYNTGGYLESISFGDSREDANVSYHMSPTVVLKDKKPIRLDVDLFQGYLEYANQPVFSEYKIETLANLIASLSGDKEGAKTFLENFKIDGPKSGKLGEKVWTLTAKGSGKYQLSIE